MSEGTKEATRYARRYLVWIRNSATPLDVWAYDWRDANDQARDQLGAVVVSVTAPKAPPGPDDA